MVTELLDLARKELGTVETGPGQVKYNTAYYGRAVAGGQYAWCAVFIWWLFRQAGISRLYFDGGKTAYVPSLLHWARGRKLLADAPQPGDLVIFDFSGKGKAQHIGLCESADRETVTTIDGNTGSGSTGGKVLRRRRSKRTVLAVIRPDYPKEEAMTQEEFDKYMDNLLKRQADRQPDRSWQIQGLDRATQAGITDGTRPLAFCTRVEAAIMAANALERRE